MGTLTDLPTELLAGWALWLAGGLALMLWFRRRSARPSIEPPPPVGAPGPRSSSVRIPVARPAPSGVHAAAVRSRPAESAGPGRAATPAGTGPAAASAPDAAESSDDAFAELAALLDGPMDSDAAR